jgi:hypothetical protein
MPEANPYDPPRSDLGRARGPARYRPLVTVARVFVGLWGLFILAGPSRNGPNVGSHGGQIVAKALGALLFLVSVFPFGPPSKKPGVAEPAAEDL